MNWPHIPRPAATIFSLKLTRPVSAARLSGKAAEMKDAGRGSRNRTGRARARPPADVAMADDPWMTPPPGPADDYPSWPGRPGPMALHPDHPSWPGGPDPGWPDVEAVLRAGDYPRWPGESRPAAPGRYIKRRPAPLREESPFLSPRARGGGAAAPASRMVSVAPPEAAVPPPVFEPVPAPPAPAPLVRPVAPPAPRRAARPATGPAHRVKGPAKSRAKGAPRQLLAIRVATAAAAALVLLALAAGSSELTLHGFAVFVFRSAGTGETGPTGHTENQGPG